MFKVYYSRVSTSEQSDERQLQDLQGFDYVISDKCSGLIPLWERPKGSQIKKLINEGKLSELHIHNIDRLGRSTLDVLSVWKELTDLGVRIVCRNPNFQNITDDGKTDVFSELMISILSTMSSFEKRMIKIRQTEGIAIAKEKGMYKGRIIGSVETSDKFLEKQKSVDILRDLDNGYGVREIAKMRDCSFSTIYKVKRLHEEQIREKEPQL